MQDGPAEPMTWACAIDVPGPRDAGRLDRARGDAQWARYHHSGGIRWHLRSAGQGQGPRLLLLHGTGSDGQSWERLIANLSTRFCILAPDLPGHGLTGTLPAGSEGLEAFAAALQTLVDDLEVDPDLIVGHSAGAAIAARMALNARTDRPAVISINGALRPLAGWTAATFVPLARLLSANPFVPSLVACIAATDSRAVRRLLDSTGSRIDDGMLAHYERLMRSSAHVAGTLRMLVHWELKTLATELPRLGPRLTLAVGQADRTIAPQDASWVQARVPGSVLLSLPGLGHLAHEEAPDELARLVVAVALGRGLLGEPPAGTEPSR